MRALVGGGGGASGAAMAGRANNWSNAGGDQRDSHLEAIDASFPEYSTSSKSWRHVLPALKEELQHTRNTFMHPWNSQVMTGGGGNGRTRADMLLFRARVNHQANRLQSLMTGVIRSQSEADVDAAWVDVGWDNKDAAANPAYTMNGDSADRLGTVNGIGEVPGVGGEQTASNQLVLSAMGDAPIVLNHIELRNNAVQEVWSAGVDGNTATDLNGTSPEEANKPKGTEQVSQLQTVVNSQVAAKQTAAAEEAARAQALVASDKAAAERVAAAAQPPTPQSTLEPLPVPLPAPDAVPEVPPPVPEDGGAPDSNGFWPDVLQKVAAEALHHKQKLQSVIPRNVKATDTDIIQNFIRYVRTMAFSDPTKKDGVPAKSILDSDAFTSFLQGKPKLSAVLYRYNSKDAVKVPASDVNNTRTFLNSRLDAMKNPVTQQRSGKAPQTFSATGLGKRTREEC
jgi:hypothetical protein